MKPPINIETRPCGAVVLAAVLQQHGRRASAEELWSEAAMADPFGTHGTRSYRLAGLARHFGLEAAVVQCRSERAWDALTHCCQHPVSVILNHQTPWARREGHYSRLLGVDPTSIEVDDPIRQRRMQIERDEFLQLWKPNTEAGGFVLIGVAERAAAPERLSETGLPSDPLDAAAACPRCRAELSFTPEPLFRPDDWSRGGLWRRFFCHGCDAAFAPAR